MTQHNDNSTPPPVIDPVHYDGPTKDEQRSFIRGTNVLILALAVVFLVIILVYVVTR